MEAPDFLAADVEVEQQEETEASDPKLKRLAAMFEVNKAEKARLEAELKETNRVLKELEEVLLPEEMNRLGMVKNNKGSFTTPSGMRVSLRTDVYASTVEAKKDEFFEWLRDNGAGSLIKETVHSQTLRAYVREQRENGVTIPEDLISVYEVTKAVLTKR